MKIHLELPRDWQALLLPEPLQECLQNLLDLQDSHGNFSSQERREAEAWCSLWTCWHSCDCERTLRRNGQRNDIDTVSR